MPKTKTATKEAPTPFTTLPVSDHPDQTLPSGVTYVTTDEMRFLKEWSWGPDAFRIDCPACGETVVLEKDPGDWPSHPDAIVVDHEVETTEGTVYEAGETVALRVQIECPFCTNKFHTEGENEREFSLIQRRVIMDEVLAEVNRRMMPPDARPDEVVEVLGHDSVGSTEAGAAKQSQD